MCTLKAKQYNPNLTENFALVFGLKTSLRLEREDLISKIAFGPEKSSGVLQNARLNNRWFSQEQWVSH